MAAVVAGSAAPWAEPEPRAAPPGLRRWEAPEAAGAESARPPAAREASLDARRGPREAPSRPTALGASPASPNDAAVAAPRPGGPRTPWAERLASALDRAEDEAGGALSLFVRDLAADREYAEDADAPVYLSSTIKVVVMLEALRQIDAGEISLRDSVIFGPGDLRDGIGPLRRSSLGRSLSVRALLGLMMDESDNAAADLLMGILGMENINRLPAARGAHFSLLVTLLDERRLVYGRLDPAGYGLTPEQLEKLREPPTLDAQAALFSSMIGRSPAFTGEDLAAAFGAYYARRINSASMRDMGKLLSQIASCEELSPESCALARRLMASCATGANRVRAGLPPGVEWGHKTGTQVGRACDVGILYARPGRPIVIAACTRDFETVRDAERLMANVGRAVWKAMSPDLESADERTPPSP